MVNNYYLSNGDIQLAPHFNLSEFQCKNGTDMVLVSDVLTDKLEELRDYIKADSLIINSGYRTPEYSVSVGGSENDPHTKGIAADIYAYRNGELISGSELCCAAQTIGFGGIGYMGNAIHVDVRGDEEYFNNHWWGNENEGCNVDDWYDYFGIERPVVEAPVDEITDASDNVVEEPADTYTVAEGECLSTIGDKLGIDWIVIAEANCIVEPYTIYPGQVLIVPGTVAPVEEVVEAPSNDIVEDKIAVSDNSVADAQTYLNQKYKLGISVDNIYGPETRRALIKAFQIETGCVVDGIWGDECRAAANRFAFTKGNNGNLIYVWQCALVCADYNPNGIDGIFGDGCLSATKDFQDGKCAVDGVVGADTWSAIF